MFVWVERDVVIDERRDEVSRHHFRSIEGILGSFEGVTYREASRSDAVGEHGTVVSIYFTHRNSDEAREEVVQDHSFKRIKQGFNSDYDTLDVLPFVLKYEGNSGIGGLWPFEGNFGEGFKGTPYR